MSSHAKPTTATIIPCLRYRNAPAMIEWLCKAFGFEKHAVYADGDVVQHAQLTFGNGMIMLGSVSDEGEYGKVLVQPDEIKGRQTQTVYLQVNDADRVCERARNAGAIILQEPSDTEFGSRGFMCRDLEGHVWNVGTYDPWKPEDLFLTNS